MAEPESFVLYSYSLPSLDDNIAYLLLDYYFVRNYCTISAYIWHGLETAFTACANEIWYSQLLRDLTTRLVNIRSMSPGPDSNKSCWQSLLFRLSNSTSPWCLKTDKNGLLKSDLRSYACDHQATSVSSWEAVNCAHCTLANLRWACSRSHHLWMWTTWEGGACLSPGHGLSAQPHEAICLP